MMQSPRDSDISVVVQGPVLGALTDPPDLRWTKLALESVRRVLPGAELILSTWEGADTTGLDADSIIQSLDPGATPHAIGSGVNNVNRQIVSTRTGVLAAQRPFILKMRSESVLVHDGFLKHFGRFKAASPTKVLRERVLGLTQPSPVPRDAGGVCFSPSDWFYFGLREDVQDIWDIPNAPEPETTRWFETHPFPPEIGFSKKKLRYSIEQYIWVTFLRKHYEVDFDSYWDIRDETIAASEASIAGNLVLLSPKQAGVHSLKHPASTDLNMIDHIRRGFYTHPHWQVLYRRYSEGGVGTPEPYMLLFRSLRRAGAAYRALRGRAS